MIAFSKSDTQFYYFFAFVIISVGLSATLATAVPLQKDEIGALINIYLPIFIGVFTIFIFLISRFTIKSHNKQVIVLLLCVGINSGLGITLNLTFNQFNNAVETSVPTNETPKRFVTLSSYHAGANRSGKVTVKNLDGFTAANQAIFSFAFDPNQIKANKQNTFNNHDLSTIRITNDRSEKLIIRGAHFSDPRLWELSPLKTAFPITLMPGDSVDMNIKFTPASLNERVNSSWWKALLKFHYSMISVGRALNYQHPYGSTYATVNGGLSLITNDELMAVKQINLRSIWEYKYENDWEPGLQTILNALGFNTNVGFKYFDNGIKGDKVIPGSDEINADYFIAADRKSPVTITKIAAYHGCCTTEDADTLAVYYPISNLTRKLQYTDQRSGQMILPKTYNLLAKPTSVDFKQPFAIQIGLTYTDRSKNFHNKIGIRVWKAIDNKGDVIKDAYILGSDYLGKKGTNYDYQDNVYLIKNIKIFEFVLNSSVKQQYINATL